MSSAAAPLATTAFEGEALESALRRDGALAIDGLVDPGLIARCGDYIARGDGIAALQARAKQSNPGRFVVALPVDGPLADPAIYANPAVLEVAERILGPDFVIDSFGAFISMPGAAAQHLRRDGMLYPETPLDRMLPPFALHLALPLVPMDPVSGSTAFSLGSHRAPGPPVEPDFAPTLATGSGLMWDYRVRHRGMANHSNVPRPVLFAVYCIPWWQDSGNFDFGRLDKLLISRATMASLDETSRRLLVRARPIEDDDFRMTNRHA